MVVNDFKRESCQGSGGKESGRKSSAITGVIIFNNDILIFLDVFFDGILKYEI